MSFWSPKTYWEGQDCFIVGGGKSLEQFDWSLLYDEYVIGCNDAYVQGQHVVDICVFGDTGWFGVHEDKLYEFAHTHSKPVFTANVNIDETWVWNMKRMEWGFYKDALGWNGNTGSLAINLALILGATNIYLLGFDMQLTDGKSNWHPNNIDVPSTEPYERFKRCFRETCDREWQKTFPGQHVWNVTKNSALESFPKIDFDKFWEKRKCAIVA